MNSKYKLWLLLCVPIIAVSAAGLFLHYHDAAVFNPEGIIATKEHNLIMFALLLSLIVVVPVFGLTFFIVWRYREDNSEATYSPDWDHSRVLETIWWGVPLILILILSVVTWQSSHDLDPARPLSSSTPTMTIEVVALDWKWLFIYPEQHIASVNYVAFPMTTPVNFHITADAPMNSFWIPSLGGQIYAMSGMTTQLHLMADGAGKYRGSSANISGRGFAGMHFTAESKSQNDFDLWTQSVKEQSSKALTMASYDQLSQPSQNNKAVTYSSVDPDLYNKILMKYMLPSGQVSGAER